MLLNAKRILSLCLLLTFTILSVKAQAPKFSNEFLAIGVSADAHGMGTAVVAGVNDGTAGYWNPAGLSLLEPSFQVNAMHAEWFGQVANYDYISFAKSLDGASAPSAVSVSVIRLGIDNIPYTFNLIGPDGSVNYDAVTPFSAADYAIMVSYGRDFSKKIPGLRLGGNTKIIYRTAGRFAKAWGFGLDFGAQYDFKDFTFGIMARDVTSTFNAWSFSYTDEELGVLQLTGNEVSENSLEVTTPTFILGAGYGKRFSEDKIGFKGEVDFEFTTDGQRNVLISSGAINIDPSLGFQVDYNRFVFLRAGLTNFQRVLRDDGNKSLIVQPNIGVGVKIGSFEVDYALTNAAGASDINYSHVISLGINFDRREKKEPVILDAIPEVPENN